MRRRFRNHCGVADSRDSAKARSGRRQKCGLTEASVHGILENAGRLERNRARGGNVNGFPGARMSPDTRRPVCRGKRSESADRDLFSARQGIADFREQDINGGLRGNRGHKGVGGDAIDNVRFRYSTPPGVLRYGRRFAVLSRVESLLSSPAVPVSSISCETGAAGFRCLGGVVRADKIHVMRRVTVTDALEQMEVLGFKNSLSLNRFMHGCRIVGEDYNAQVPSSA